MRAFGLIKKCLQGISQGNPDLKMLRLLLTGIRKPGLRLHPAEGLYSSGKSQADPSGIPASHIKSSISWQMGQRPGQPDQTLNSAGSSQAEVFMRWLQDRPHTGVQSQHLVPWSWAMGVNWGPGQTSGHYQSQSCNVNPSCFLLCTCGCV